MGPVLKRNGEELSADQWVLYAGGVDDGPPPNGDWLFAWPVWEAYSEKLAGRDRLALCLDTAFDAEKLAQVDLEQFRLIGIHFETFQDGRGLSLAVELRKHCHYQGELRALGDILPDMIDYLVRCGFDTFVVRNQEELAEARKNLSVMDHYYSASVTNPRPLFRNIRRQPL